MAVYLEELALFIIECEAPVRAPLVYRSCVLMCRPMLVSSAKIAQRVSCNRKVGRSFMYRIKSKGSGMDPCGTPEVT